MSGKNVSSSEKKPPQTNLSGLLVPIDQYLEKGVHIGTIVATKSMKRFIYRVRPDGVYVLDIKKTDSRIRLAANFLSNYDPEKVVVVAARQYAQVPATKMARMLRFKIIPGRLIPGTFTHPLNKNYVEPELVFINDPNSDKQALLEAKEMGITIVGLCDTDNDPAYLDFIIPSNNKGRKALALIYYLITEQTMKVKGLLGADENLSESVDDFMFKLTKQ